MKVAVAQIEARRLDVEHNVGRTCDAIAEAADQGAGLVVLPETVASGWVLDPDGMELVAESADGSGLTLSSWQEKARECGVAVIGGYPERGDDGHLYNAVAVIDRTGRLVGGFRKLHLFGREDRMFSPGDLGLPIFELDGLNIGVLVCYDLRFPETMRLLALHGAELIAVPTAWVIGYDPNTEVTSSRIGQIEGALVQANLNQVYVACADLAGTIDDVTFLGRSLIASPYGQPIAGPLAAEGEGVVLADIDPAEVERARERGDGISPRRDRRTDVYALEFADSSVDSESSEDLLVEIERKRGYVLDLHRTLAKYDPAFLEVYEHFLEGSFLRERSLDRRTKELIYVGVLMALGTPESHLVAHMRAAVDNGATQTEVLEVLEQTLAPAGVPHFITGLRAFEAAFADVAIRAPAD